MKHPWFSAHLHDDELLVARARLRSFHAKRRLQLLRNAVWTRILVLNRTGQLKPLAERIAREFADD
jgi:hypothetical protein